MQHWTWVQDLLGPQQLKGKSFYLDCVKSRHSSLLLKAIAHHGGSVEGFLNKDVNVVISGSQEAWLECQPREAQRLAGGTKSVAPCPPVSTRHRQSEESTGSQRSATPRPPVCGSRGKALLEKAISKNERCCGSSVLANARLWGVKIVHVDHFLLYLERLAAATARAKNKKKKAGGSSTAKLIKVECLKSPYLKIEDSSRKYRPVHLQSTVFPTLGYTGRFSPFEPPAPPPPEAEKDQKAHKSRQRRADPSTSQEKLPAPLLLTPSPRRARNKTVGFCECCQLAFKEQDEHLKSDQHRGFVQDSSHYSVVDQLVALMEPVFADRPVESPAAMRLPPPPDLLRDFSLELDPQAPSETEKAIQALLSQEHSPPPAQGTAAPPVSPAHPSALTAAAPAPSPLPPSHCCLGLGMGGPPAESSRPTPSPQTDALRRPLPSPAPNLRKRRRASSLSPRPSKRRRTGQQPLSDPTGPCSPRAPNLVLNSTHPTHEPPSLPLPLPAPAGCVSQSDAPRAAGLRKEEEPESGGALPSCGLESSPHDRPTLTTSSVSHELQGSEPRPRGLPSVGSALVEDLRAPVAGLPLPPPPSFQGCLWASGLPSAFSAYLQPPRKPRDCAGLPPLPCPSAGPSCAPASPESDATLSQSYSSVFMELGLLPNPSACSPSSSESDWDCGLLSRLAPAVPPPASGGQCLLDLELLQRPCAGMQDRSYESRLCSVLHPPTPPPSVCGEDTDPALISRTTDHCLEACVLQGLGVNV